MRPESEYRRALELIREGVNDCEIGRRLGIPRGTIRDWRVGVEMSGGGPPWIGLADGFPPASGATGVMSTSRRMPICYSEDIRQIFTDALDRLDIHWTLASRRNISLARREDVAFLDTFVGPKS